MPEDPKYRAQRVCFTAYTLRENDKIDKEDIMDHVEGLVYKSDGEWVDAESITVEEVTS